MNCKKHSPITKPLLGVALVTGGGRGIGRAIAERLAWDGMRVAVAARTRGEVESVAEAVGATALLLDATDSIAVANAVDAVERQLGPIDLLINNAGVAEWRGPLWQRDPDEWWRVFEVNVLGSFLLMRTVLRRMIERRRGRSVNPGSQSAYTRVDGAAANSAYMGGKAALARITGAVAHDARPHGVFVFTI